MPDSQARQPSAAGACFAVKVTPRAARTGWAGRHGDAVRIRVAAPPVDDRANRELTRFLAEEFGVAASAVDVVAGAASPRKLVQIRGWSADELARRLARAGV